MISNFQPIKTLRDLGVRISKLSPNTNFEVVEVVDGGDITSVTKTLNSFKHRKKPFSVIFLGTSQ